MKVTIKSKYFTCEHKGGLYAAMRSEKCIIMYTFYKLVKSGLYKYYAYDARINSHVYILDDMSNNLGLASWLHRSVRKRVCGFYDDTLYRGYLF